MYLSELLLAGSALGDPHANSKKQVLRALSKRAADLSGLESEVIFDRLLQREKLGSTSIGEGVAIPHAKLVGLDRVFIVVARMKKPIDFDAPDGQPVDIIIALFAPEGAGAEHLKALAKVARSFSNQHFLTRLRQCPDDETFAGVLALKEVDAA